jgi:hypothetical protein
MREGEAMSDTKVNQVLVQTETEKLLLARLQEAHETLEAAREALRGQVALTLDVQRERDELRASLSHETLMELRNALATATRERDHLRALFDAAGQGEHNVLALVEHWQREALEASAEAAEARAVLADTTRALHEKCETCEVRQGEVARVERELDEARAALDVATAEDGTGGVAAMRRALKAEASNARLREALARLMSLDGRDQTYCLDEKCGACDECFARAAIKESES